MNDNPSSRRNRTTKETTMSTKAIFATGLTGLALATMPAAQAATIIWDPVGSVGSSTEVNNEGTTVLAYQLNNDGSSRTANGVTFTDSTTQNGVSWGLTKVGLGTHYIGQSHFVTGSPMDYFSGPDASEYVEILRGLQDAQGDITITLTGLTVGQEYLTQIWAVDMRNGGGSGLTQTISLDGGTASGTMTRTASPGGVSSYVIGRFTADATSASFVITSSTNDRGVNAFQLRAIPEPSALGLAALGFAGLLRRRR
jgi:uncharacterized protein (TIGR03382 family)